MNDTQTLIADSARRLFASAIDSSLLQSAERGQWPEALWRDVEASGFTGVLVPEPDAGISGCWMDAYPLLHAAGYHAVPLPIAETVIARGLLARAGLDIPPGPLTILQAAGADSPRITRHQGCLQLSGRANAVPWAGMASAIVVAGECEGRSVLALVRAGAAGLAIEPGTTISREARDQVDFAHCRSAEWVHWPTGLDPQPVLLCGALARAIMIVGASEFTLDQAVAYANDRVQFGRPIGKFQAIQQALAAMAGDFVAARTAALAAADSGDVLPARFAVAVAKVRAGITAGASAATAHQVLGAIGFTDEHRLHYGTRRLWSWRSEFGADNSWARELGRGAIARGGRSFWPYLTGRQTPSAP